MSEAKDGILGRIQKALKDVPEDEHPEDVKVPRDFRRKGENSRKENAEFFSKRVNEYRANVKLVNQNELSESIAESCQSEKVKKLVVPVGFPEQWIPGSITPVFDSSEAPLTNKALDSADGVITTCALAIAQTGTIILDAGKGQGRRVLTLLPDFHLCLVRQDQIVELVPEAFAHFESPVKRTGRPITFISGPSATSDIELSRVEGVHGPRRLEVIIYK